MIGIFYAVHRELGYGFSEVIYQRALVIALNDAGLRARAAVPIDVWFRGRQIGHFLADIVVEDTVLLELKAADDIDGYVQCQVLNYLKAAGGGLGFILNFGRSPRFKRMVMGDPANSLPRLREAKLKGAPDGTHPETMEHPGG
jgi:GxxExxY protein